MERAATFRLKTFTYYMEEVPGTDTEHYQYSNECYEVTVEVKDNGEGKLDTRVVSIIGSTGSIPEATFNNIYTDEDEIILSVQKTLNGQEMPDPKEFKFSFKLEDVTEYEDGEAGLASQTKESDSSGKAIFDAIRYDQDDVGSIFTYKISEVPGRYNAEDAEDGTGYTYDPAVYLVEVKVTLNEETDEIETEMTYARYADGNTEETENADTTGGSTTETGMEFAFTNSYNAKGQQTISGTKEVTYRDKEVTPMKPGEFTFCLKENGTPVQGAKNIPVQEDGTFSYTIDYDLMDESPSDTELAALASEEGWTRTYTLEENGTDDAGMDYSDQVYEIQITLWDNGDGTLTASEPVYKDITGVTGSTADVEKAENVIFINTYKANGNAVLNITKNLTGNRADGIGENEFGFTATEVDKDGNAVVGGQTVTSQLAAANADNGDTAMGTITLSYDQTDLNADGSEKTYWYKVTENEVTSAGVTKDNALYYAKVVVSDGGSHSIDAEVSYHTAIEGEELTNEEGAVLNSMTFINSYNAKGEATLNITKNLTGNRTEEIGKNEFSFTATEVDKDGNAVTNGQTATSQLAAANANNGDTAAGTISLSYDQDDLNADGTAKTYWYKVTENEVTSVGVTKDNALYYAKVVVNDGKEGKINTKVTYHAAIDGAELTDEETGAVLNSIIFTNNYNAKGDATLNITKKLTGNRKDGIGKDEFRFTATEVDKGGNAVVGGKTATSEMLAAGADDKYTAAGTITLSYNQDDLNADGSEKTYWYKVTENEVTSAGVTKGDPNALYYAKVDVSDGKEGKINTKVTYHAAIDGAELTDEKGAVLNGMTFTNNYHATGTGEIDLTKSLTGRPTGLSPGRV